MILVFPQVFLAVMLCKFKKRFVCYLMIETTSKFFLLKNNALSAYRLVIA